MAEPNREDIAIEALQAIASLRYTNTRTAGYVCLATHRLATDALMQTGDWPPTGHAGAKARAEELLEQMPGYRRQAERDAQAAIDEACRELDAARRPIDVRVDRETTAFAIAAAVRLKLRLEDPPRPRLRLRLRLARWALAARPRSGVDSD